MIGLFRALFPPNVNMGDVFEFDEEKGGPFSEGPHRVIVKGVRSGWINYRFEKGDLWQNESLPRRTFAFCYRRPNEKLRGR